MKSNIFVLILSLISISGLYAQQVSGQNKGYKNGMNVCMADRQKFCKKEKGHANIHACMDKHLNDLSVDCRSFHSEMSTEVKSKAHEACVKDIEKYCSEIEPGQGRMRECFRVNKDKISSECKKFHKNL